MVVLSVGHRAHDALAHILRNSLPRELEISKRRIDLLAADEFRNEVQLSRRNPEVARDGFCLVLRQTALSAWLTHYRLAFLSPPCPGKFRVGANSPNL